MPGHGPNLIDSSKIKALRSWWLEDVIAQSPAVNSQVHSSAETGIRTQRQKAKVHIKIDDE